VATERSDLFRALNERIRLLQGPSLPEYDLICECGGEDCTRVMRMRPGEYEAARADPLQFAVVPGHEERFGRVLSRTDRYVVVRKEH
jgi:hypothetical protein